MFYKDVTNKPKLVGQIAPGSDTGGEVERLAIMI